MQDTIIATIPEIQQDFVLSCLRFREEMPKEIRKYLIGPIVHANGDRCFVFSADVAAKSKTNEYVAKFLDHIKSNKCVHFCYIAITEENAAIVSSSYKSLNVEDVENHYVKEMRKLENEWWTKESDLNKQINKLRSDKSEVDEIIYAVKKERDEAVRNLNKDLVLSEAVQNLKALRNKKKIIDAAAKVAKEFKDKENIPESIKELLESMK